MFLFEVEWRRDLWYYQKVPTASVAQLVEHPTDTRAVPGSIPGTCTTICSVIPTLRGGERGQRYTRAMWGHTGALRRETLMLIGALLLFCIGLPVLFFSFSDTQSSLTATVPFTKLTAGRQSVVAKRVNYVITSPTQLSELWEIVSASGTPPEVDFETQAVLAVFAGNESSSSIAIAKIEDTTARTVSIAITKPDCTKPPSVASPYEIVAVSATSLPLTHTDIPITVSCPR